MKAQNIIIQSPLDGTTVKSGRRIVHDITRDEIGNEFGTVTIVGQTYQVLCNGTTWYGEAAGGRGAQTQHNIRKANEALGNL